MGFNPNPTEYNMCVQIISHVVYAISLTSVYLLLKLFAQSEIILSPLSRTPVKPRRLNIHFKQELCSSPYTNISKTVFLLCFVTKPFLFSKLIFSVVQKEIAEMKVLSDLGQT